MHTLTTTYYNVITKKEYTVERTYRYVLVMNFVIWWESLFNDTEYGEGEIQIINQSKTE